MCNKRIECLRQPLQSEAEIDQQQQYHQAQSVYLMDSPTMTLGSVPSPTDESPRVKFLCSFNGSILPRPQDGKLRYVGGETRIVSVPREIGFDELMMKMRELFDGAAVLKYQQPDEDLDALVSVVNDDDVTNMMEEYDKLGSGDGFTRLRIFLFSGPDHDSSVHFVDGDERDNERRYVDALNSLNDSPNFIKGQANESLLNSPVDDIHAAEQYFSQMSIDGGVHGQRNFEMPMPQINLRHLTIPHVRSSLHQQSTTQRYNEMEAPWSPAYYSPRHVGHHDPRPVNEFSTSPTSARYGMPYGEFSDRNLDRINEEYSRQQVNHQSPYDHQPHTHLPDNFVWLPTGPLPGDKAGFPGNILHGSGFYEGNSICEHCRTAFHRNHAYGDSPWTHEEPTHLELPNIGNGFHQVASPCAECPPNREAILLNTESKLHHPFYPREQNDPRSLYNETQNYERGWVLPHQSTPRAEEPRPPPHISAAGRLNDHYTIDGTLPDGQHVPSHYVHHEDQPRYIRPGTEMGNEAFLDQPMAIGSPHTHVPLEERGVRYGNLPYAYGPDNNLYQMSHGPVVPGPALLRNVHNPIHGVPSYDGCSSHQQANGPSAPGLVRGTLEGSPRFRAGVENQNPWIEPSPNMVGLNALKMMPHTYNLENQHLITQDPTRSPREMLNIAANPRDPLAQPDSVSTFVDDKSVLLTTPLSEIRNDANETDLIKMEKKSSGGAKETKHDSTVHSNMQGFSGSDQNKNLDDVAYPKDLSTNQVEKKDEVNALENADLQVERMSFLPELMASVKKAALMTADDVKARVQGSVDSVIGVPDETTKEVAQNEIEALDGHGDLEVDSDSDSTNTSKIEPTKAEEEAISRGLQTIRNDDLEEIRELGSGTYGAVYHGKWKGSDVAIKRIKASCFAGRPSERERLIADFWKEALILSSLHHPNVVSFYGIVRDGPDGSLATVTEFMVNGSLKQFLQKKDRTIDRRKRLIIAMDAAFGMEYLHGKNIVHFDLKCENLLVNMRDPHRPVCKIGDLGLSKVKQHTLVSGGVRGTLPWMAPELLSGKSNMVTEKIDVYSFGIVMWELLTGDEPYADMHCASIIGGIVNNSLRPTIPTWCDPEWKSLMGSCWASDPAQRPSFSEISQKLRTMAAAINLK